MRKTLIVIMAFVTGIMTTAFAASLYDTASIKQRSDNILSAIKTNAAKLDPAQVPAYYALVLMNVRSLVAVLGQVDTGIIALSDSGIIAELIPLPVTPPVPPPVIHPPAPDLPPNIPPLSPDLNASCTGTKPTGAGVKIFDPTGVKSKWEASNVTAWSYVT